MTSLPDPTFALALGAGGARGLAHIAVLEAFDELGIRPAAVAGSSIGALIGAGYAAGMSGRSLRAFALERLHDRRGAMSALFAARVRRSADRLGRGTPFLLDAERLLHGLLPADVPKSFDELRLPLLVVATDFSGRGEALFGEGPLVPAIAGSIALPGLFKPVRFGGRTLVDGGAVNPLPVDVLSGRATTLVAVDVTGVRFREPFRTPGRFDAMFGTLQIMQASIVAAKLGVHRPDVLVRPAVDSFRVLDFFRARPIFAAAHAVKDELKRELERHLRAPRPFPDGGARLALPGIAARPGQMSEGPRGR